MHGPMLWRDNSGKVIAGPTGEDLQIPLGFDVQGVLAAAKATSVDNKPAQLWNLMKFFQGSEWDMQRLTGKFDGRFRDSATVLIGAYAAATGMSLQEILKYEQDYARLNSRWSKDETGHEEYLPLPERNVANTYWGYHLVRDGRLKP